MSALGSLASILPYLEPLFRYAAAPPPSGELWNETAEQVLARVRAEQYWAAYKVQRHPDDKD